MPKVDLPGGHSAVLALRMEQFREMWQSGAIKKLQGMNADGADLGDLYPLLATAVKSWDCTDENGNALDPSQVESYDQIEPAEFMRLMTVLAQYVGGMEAKN
jgi:hypothetical protein